MNQIDSLPDYGPEDPYWSSVSALYRAGVLTGDDIYGTFRPNSNIRRSELAAILVRLVRPEYRKIFTLTPLPQEVIETIVYGKSGAGRELKAYRYGDGSNVLVAAFAIHGWEDNFNRDGQLLVDTAHDLMEALEQNYDALIKEGDWSVYVLPCLNPDGLYDGWTCNGPGRCTTYRLMPTETTSMARASTSTAASPTGIRARAATGITTARLLSRPERPRPWRNSSSLSKAPEAMCYSSIPRLVSPDHCLRRRGGPVYRAFNRYFPQNRYTSLAGGSGYFASWAAYVEDYDACLFEFPRCIQYPRL